MSFRVSSNHRANISRGVGTSRVNEGVVFAETLNLTVTESVAASADATMDLSATAGVSFLTISNTGVFDIGTAALGVVKLITTVAGASAATLDGSNIQGVSTVVFDAAGQSATLVSNGTNWALAFSKGATVNV